MVQQLTRHDDFPGISLYVYAPNYYNAKNPTLESYSKMIWQAKKEDISSHFIPLLEPILDRDLPKLVHLIICLPNRFGEHSPTLKSICKHLSQHYRCPTILMKRKKTLAKSQSKCANSHERASNVKDTMDFERSISPTETFVLLVDDVKTSGASLLEAVRILNKTGRRSVTGLCLGINQPLMMMR